MPPKTRVTAEMIVDAAVEVVRQSGFEAVLMQLAVGSHGVCLVFGVLLCSSLTL